MRSEVVLPLPAAATIVTVSPVGNASVIAVCSGVGSGCLVSRLSGGIQVRRVLLLTQQYNVHTSGRQYLCKSCRTCDSGDVHTWCDMIGPCRPSARKHICPRPLRPTARTSRPTKTS